MITRSILNLLVFGLVLLIVAFAVLMGFQAIVSSLGDAAGARVLLWTATGTLILLVVDAVLLVVTLGFRALERDRGE